MRDCLQTTRALTINCVEGSGIWETEMVQTHAACFCEAKFGEDVADEDVVYIGGLDVGSSDGFNHDLEKL